MLEGTGAAFNVKESGLLSLVEKQRQMGGASGKGQGHSTVPMRKGLVTFHRYSHADFQQAIRAVSHMLKTGLTGNPKPQISVLHSDQKPPACKPEGQPCEWVSIL